MIGLGYDKNLISKLLEIPVGHCKHLSKLFLQIVVPEDRPLYRFLRYCLPKDRHLCLFFVQICVAFNHPLYLLLFCTLATRRPSSCLFFASCCKVKFPLTSKGLSVLSSINIWLYVPRSRVTTQLVQTYLIWMPDRNALSGWFLGHREYGTTLLHDSNKEWEFRNSFHWKSTAMHWYRYVYCIGYY